MSVCPETRDVVVIGGGPTGLLLGIALRHYDLDTLIVDREPSTKREPRACVIWQRALEGLRDLGCADTFMAAGLPLRRAVFQVRGRLVGEHEMGMPDTAFPGPLSIEQDATEHLLRDRLRQLGADVEWCTEAVDVRAEQDGAEVVLRGPGGRTRVVGCRWVVGCEGAHSIVRGTQRIPFEGKRRDNLQSLQINAKPEWRHPYEPDVTRIFVNTGVSLIASPIPGGGHRFFAFCPDPDPALDAPPNLDEMTALVAAAAADPGIRLVPTSPPWANRARFHDRVAATLRHGSALIAGDSAHCWAPIGGRGLNTGLRGAHNLGWKLAAVHHGWAADALLDTYSTEQRRTAQQVIKETRRNVLELPPGRPMLTALNLLIPAVLASDRGQRRGRALLSDFIKNHRESALSTDAGGRGPLRPGDRLPDLPVTAERGPCHLHDLLSYRRWSLLLVPAEADGAAAAGEARRLAGRFAAPVEVHAVRPEPARHPVLPPGTLLLMRPDGHLGLRARTDDHRALEAYLRRWFVPA